MTFTYTGNLDNPLDYIRFIINDRDEDDPIYSDEEIQYFITSQSAYTEIEYKKIALQLLKKHLQELLRSPSRERSGGYEVYLATSESLKAAIKELEKDVKDANTPSISFGGVYKAEVERNRCNPAHVGSKFYDSRIYGDD